MAEKSGGEQTPHWQCAVCGYELHGVILVLKFCPECRAEQDKKPYDGRDAILPRCVQCFSLLLRQDQPKCHMCGVPQKHTPAPPEAKVTAPEANTDTSDKGNRKLLDAEGRQFPEPRTLAKETAPPHGQSATAAAASVPPSGTVAGPSGQPGPAKPIQATQPLSPPPKQKPQESDSTKYKPSTTLEPASKAVLVTGKESRSEIFFDAESSFHKRDTGSHDSASPVLKLSYKKEFGSEKSDKSTKDNDGAAPSMKMENQQQQGEDEWKKQQQRDKARKREEERKKRQKEEEREEERKKQQIEEQKNKKQLEVEREEERKKKQDEEKQQKQRKENQASLAMDTDKHPLGSGDQGLGHKRGSGGNGGGESGDGSEGGGVGGSGGTSSSTPPASQSQPSTSEGGSQVII